MKKRKIFFMIVSGIPLYITQTLSQVAAPVVAAPAPIPAKAPVPVTAPVAAPAPAAVPAPVVVAAPVPAVTTTPPVPTVPTPAAIPAVPVPVPVPAPAPTAPVVAAPAVAPVVPVPTVVAPAAVPAPAVIQPVSAAPAVVAPSTTSIEIKSDDAMDEEDEALALSNEQRGFRGNWEKKRRWLIRAKNRNAKVQELDEETQKFSDIFQDKYFKIDQELDAFWASIGLSQEKLTTFFASIEKYLSKQRNEKIADILEKEAVGELLTPDEMEQKDKAEEQAENYKKLYDTFKEDIKALAGFKKELNDRLKKLEELITTSMNASIESRKKYEEIWEIIDHTKAEANYIDVKNAWNKIKSINEYIKGEFTSNFDTAIATVKSHMSKIKDLIKELESKGLIIKNRADKLDQLRKERDTRAEEERKRMESRRALGKTSWYSKILDPFMNGIYRIKQFFYELYSSATSLIGSIFGLSESPKKNLPEKNIPAAKTNSTETKNIPTPAPAPKPNPLAENPDILYIPSEDEKK